MGEERVTVQQLGVATEVASYEKDCRKPRQNLDSVEMIWTLLVVYSESCVFQGERSFEKEHTL